MKKGIVTLSLLLMSLVTTQSAFSQTEETNTTNTAKVGIGVSVLNFNQSWAYNVINLTIDTKSTFRLEPTLGFALDKNANRYFIGLGAFVLKPMPSFNLLYGMRVGFDNNDMGFLAPVVGGEYYFIEKFSIGSEVQLRGIINNGDWLIQTNAAVLLRFYF